MFNALLDPLPEAYCGYLIRTDYRIGIQIALCSQDKELDGYEKSAAILSLLYGCGAPQDEKTATEGITWFMSCGVPQKKSDAAEPEDVFSFEYDAGRILSAFRRVYHIDISREKMHWFQFMQMLGDLDGSALTSVVGYRSADLSKMSGEQRTAYAKMKKIYEIPRQSDPQQDALDDAFMRAFNKTEQ